MVVADLEEIIAAFFQDDEVGGLILAVEGIAGDGGAVEIDFGGGE